ncbi:hypothetical protein PF005_g29514 [Phytophthora fragariae]|uniref:Secreted protein n=1 Tax=Phytophthora fragariae TaxID=53985 RepID=A0A6A3PV37_9STRA|nr:hypothetical protein PF003_g18807 [Phytophthora fragariae]KAE8897184.1 hypothetical protein PF003_g18809 [Phytophthora fragariae]KAE9059997.1 hypothetical protein PF007_g30760 [Phytophthora fragariae]KAE9063488.1 hypothetical protein PF006_g30933 [Phytophthora fragariae]KAE9165653.1 hypothetical protein PF005_g29514 [Phytophthora fragariae]
MLLLSFCAVEFPVPVVAAAAPARLPPPSLNQAGRSSGCSIQHLSLVYPFSKLRVELHLPASCGVHFAASFLLVLFAPLSRPGFCDSAMVSRGLNDRAASTSSSNDSYVCVFSSSLS